MVNALAISDNIHFIKRLLSEINSYNLTIRLNRIATNKSEINGILKVLKPDLIFLDQSSQKDFDKVFQKNYKDSIITLVYKEVSPLINQKILKDIGMLIEKYDFEYKKNKIVKELQYIGYKFKYKGTHYLVDTILQMYSKQNHMIDNLQSGIYPIIAKKYNKTVHNIKSSINKATECMYYECDAARLKNYFQFNYDIKPTVKQVIFTVINKIW